MGVQNELEMPSVHPLEYSIDLGFGFAVNCFHLPEVLCLMLICANSARALKPAVGVAEV